VGNLWLSRGPPFIFRLPPFKGKDRESGEERGKQLIMEEEEKK